ncbi:MAG: calcium/sodium antiporter [Chromatiales bacterium]|jgi:cation:H+ antiporter
MFVNIIAIMTGFALLVWGADKFVNGAAAIAQNIGVSPLLIGLTIVGLGTSAPEILVAAMASLQGNPGLAIGNALGSNIANIALILGATVIVAPLTVHSHTLHREYPVLLLVTLVAAGLMLDQGLYTIDGIVLLAFLAAVLYWLIRLGRQRRVAYDPLVREIENELPEPMPTKAAVFWFAVGLIVLLGSSRLLVWGAVNIATAFGVSDLIIGLTIVAIGTSLPELAASIASALKNEHDIAIGNIIGSNIYNLLAVLSIPGLLAPGPFDTEVVLRDLPIMIGLTIALFFMGYSFKCDTARINRPEGFVMLAAFIAYQGWLFIDATGIR